MIQRIKIGMLAGLLAGLSSLGLMAQDRPLLADTDTILFVIKNKAGRPFLDWIRPSSESTGPNLMAIQWLELEDADLSLAYQLPALTAEETSKGFYYQLNFSLATDEGVVIRPEAWASKGNTGPINRNFTRLRWSWANALEDVLDFNHSFRLLASVQLQGDLSKLGLNCEGGATFTGKDKVQNLTVAAVGLGMAGAGLAYREAARKDYDAYLERWSNGQPSAEAELYYEQARKQGEISDILTWGGIAILGADIAWYAIRRKKFREKEQLYRKYCQRLKATDEPPRWGLQPEIQWNGGLQLAIRF